MHLYVYNIANIENESSKKIIYIENEKYMCAHMWIRNIIDIENWRHVHIYVIHVAIGPSNHALM